MKELNNMKKGQSILITGKGNKIEEITINALKELTKDHIGIYLSTNKTSEKMTVHLKEKGVKINKVFFIDTFLAEGDEQLNNCVHLESPTHLTEISIAMNQAIQSIPKSTKKFIIIDSIDKLIIANKKEMTLKFSKFVLDTVKNHKLKGIFLTTDSKRDKKFIEQLGGFVTKTVKE